MSSWLIAVSQYKSTIVTMHSSKKESIVVFKKTSKVFSYYHDPAGTPNEAHLIVRFMVFIKVLEYLVRNPSVPYLVRSA